ADLSVENAPARLDPVESARFVDDRRCSGRASQGIGGIGVRGRDRRVDSLKCEELVEVISERSSESLHAEERIVEKKSAVHAQLDTAFLRIQSVLDDI